MSRRLFLFLFLFFNFLSANALENCSWDNKKGIPCLTVSKTSNSSIFNDQGISKTIITKEDIINSGAIDSNDILSLPAIFTLFTISE